jgi:hypothetical protein
MRNQAFFLFSCRHTQTHTTSDWPELEIGENIYHCAESGIDFPDPAPIPLQRAIFQSRSLKKSEPSKIFKVDEPSKVFRDLGGLDECDSFPEKRREDGVSFVVDEDTFCQVVSVR